MNSKEFLENKVDWLQESIEDYERRDHPIHKFMVSHWEETVVGCLSEIDLINSSKDVPTLKIEIDGGSASKCEVPEEIRELILNDINNILNLIVEEKHKEFERIELEITKIEDCCTLLSLNNLKKLDKNATKISAESIYYLINSLKMIKKRNRDLRLVYLPSKAVEKLESLFQLMVENGFDLKFSVASHRFEKQASFNLDETNEILQLSRNI